jgi:phage I-like protein
VANPNPLPNNIAALVIDLSASTEGYPEGCNAHITPDGAFRSDDGRPASMTGGTLLDWQMSAEIAAALIAKLESSGKPILYDYEHNSMWGDSRAAGWIVKLVYVAGRGLFGRVEWTPDAAEEIAKKVYRYSSPLFYFDPKTGAVTELLSVALTNNPALGDLGAVDLVRRAALAALPLGALANQFIHSAGGLPGNQSGESDMTPEQLAALTAERDGLKTTLAALTVERDGLKTQVVALTAERDGLVAEKAQAALTAEKVEKDELIKAALSGDKPRLMPAQKEWAEKQPLASLKEYIATSAPLPLASLQAEVTAGDGNHGLSKDELAMCSKMGLTPEAFAKAKKDQA